MLALQLDFTSLLPFAVFGAIAVGAWVLSDVLFNRKSKSHERLEQIKNRTLGIDHGISITKGGKNKKDNFQKLIEAASPTLGDTLKPKSEKEISKQKAKLDSAGFRSESAPAMFNTLKMICAIIGFIIGGGVNLLMYGPTMWAFLYTLIVTGGFLFIPELVVGMIAQHPQAKSFSGPAGRT